ncbi:MAG: tyrosine-protein phosphatase [Clostridia bacterium]|nr:tyrosine-protein phosphatase [Clostridia bacterium]
MAIRIISPAPDSRVCLQTAIYYHCWGGADRTATAAFLLGALLGMDETQLIADYEFTSLSIWGIRSRNLSVFKALFDLFCCFPGETLREKAEYYFLVRLGMSREAVDLIRQTLVEEILGAD